MTNTPDTPDQVDALDAILTAAFNDFYGYITERDIIKVAHEYSEKTVYKQAKAKLSALLIEARLDELKVANEYRIFEALIDHIEDRIKELEKQREKL